MAFKGVPNPAKSSPKSKASKSVGSGSNNSGRQGNPVSGKLSRVGSVSGALGSGSKVLDPMTREALRNVGC